MSGPDSKFEAKLGEFFVEAGTVTRATLQEALKVGQSSRRALIDVLVRDYQADENALYRALSEKTGIPYRNLKEETVDSIALRLVPVKIAWHYGFMPLRVDETGNLMIAVEAPFTLKVQDEIRLQLGHGLLQVLARKQDIVDCFKKYYGFAADTVDRIVSGAGFEAAAEDQEISSIDDAGKMAGDRTVVDLVNEIIFEALQKRATDIHFEPYRGEFRIRYRIDGLLQDANLSRKAQPLIAFILSRIKIMANLDIIEKRLPQDGRAIVKIKNQALDLRVSSIPTLNGESIVIRILPTQMIFDLKKLGLTDRNIEIFEKLIRKSSGIVLLTGPTGSGKTTTLYACLNRMNSNERKIITIEDPVEYEISGITQIPIHPKAGLDFAKGLRSMLRHDPDVMMVGEIRDFETAEISIRAALTGHLVFSTLHTNDAASGVSRLLDIGVEPFLVASSVEAIVAQRLVRRLCQKCKVPDTGESPAMAEKILADLGLPPGSPAVFFRGKGCEQCGFTGFYGRTAIHEILLTGENIKQLIMKKASSYEIKAQAVAEGMKTLLQDGWQKVLAGETTPGEVLNVVSSEAPGLPVPAADESGAQIISAAGGPDPRLYRRVPISLKVVCVRIKTGGRNKTQGPPDKEEFSGLTENISASGVLMKTSTALFLGDVLELKFEASPDAGRTIHCLARVVRVEETEDGAYRTGLMFLDLPTSDRAFLDQLILLFKGALD